MSVGACRSLLTNRSRETTRRRDRSRAKVNYGNKMTSDGRTQPHNDDDVLDGTTASNIVRGSDGGRDDGEVLARSVRLPHRLHLDERARERISKCVFV